MRGFARVDFLGPGLARMFMLCCLAYLTAYALEAPIRYVLYLAGKDNLILARDGLIIGPLVVLFAARALRLEIPTILLVSGALLTFHAVVLIGTIGSFTGAAYGVKILVNLLFGVLLRRLADCAKPQGLQRAAGDLAGDARRHLPG